MSSDWKEINNLKGAGGAADANAGPISQDFQAKQIERVIDAIALTLPSGGIGGSILGGLGLGGGGNTLSTANLDSQNTTSNQSNKAQYS